MKSNSKGTPAYLVNGANLFPKAPFSPQINPTPQSHSISRINQNSIDSPSYYDPKPSNGMTFGFGLQVLKIPTQSRERTLVKPITYSSLQPNKKPPMPKLPPSANKLQREDTVEVIDQGQGRLGFKEMPNIKLAKLPKLPQISKVLDDEKPKAYSQNDISTRSRRNTKNKLEKLSLTSNKKKDERNVESFHSMYGVGTDTKREIEGLVKVQELDDPVEVKPIEIRSLNIVQKKLTYNRDSWFDLKDVKGPPRRESALGSYLSKALSEVSANVANGAVTQAISPRDNFGLEIKGQKREKDQVKEKVDRRGKVRRESEASRDAIPVQEQGTGEEPYKSEAKGIESGRVGEVKRSLRRPNSKVGKDREKKKKEKVEVKKEKEEDDSKIEEYRFEVHSDEDLSLDEYLKAKKENQENNETEEMEYDFLSKQEL